MIGKLLKENLLLILLSAFILLLTIPAYGNEVYINQVGTNVEVTIVQDGQNNRISTKSTAASNATLYGQNQTINFLDALEFQQHLLSQIQLLIIISFMGMKIII